MKDKATTKDEQPKSEQPTQKSAKFIRRAEIILSPSNDGVSFGSVKAMYVLGIHGDNRYGTQPLAAEPALSSENLKKLNDVWGEIIGDLVAQEGASQL